MTPDCINIRKQILQISYESGHGHIPTCFSIVEMLYSLYEVMKHDPLIPEWEERDLFVLSKGHAALAHYTVLAHYGYFPIERVNRFGLHGSDFGCHADRHKVSGVEVSTGSLGHGVNVAAGMALAEKIKKRNTKVYTLIGDGESNEGTVWESMLVAADQGLSNYTVLYDNNMSHGRGLQIKNPAEKFTSFGASVHEVDGHDIGAIKKALNAPTDSYKVIVCNTVKGYGSALLTENQYAWHRRSPTDEELKQMIGELDARTV
ncbi:transketolase [Desulfospira joergensenii]|uniref:transketolase n=1 Tax=Desulfospira joergensenii TaxID=53329 RepID=UPI0003B7B388|nr:transketolase [Desulfospira joergensenii]